MRKAVILGAGGFGLEALQIVRDIGDLEIVGFVDALAAKQSQMVGGVKVLGGDDELERLRREGVRAAFVAIGDSRVRQRLSELLVDLGYHLPAVVHPRAYVAADVVVGRGTIVYPGAVVMPGCRFADGVLVNAATSFGHEVTVSRFANINPGAHIAGRVNIGERALVGVGSSILEDRSIGGDARVGAGAVVTKDVPPASTVAGVPATLL